MKLCRMDGTLNVKSIKTAIKHFGCGVTYC